MNFRQKITVSLLLYMVLCFPLFAEMVDIPDPNLRAAVREALDLPASALLTDDNLWQLRGLSAEGRNITTLDGLEHAIGLRELDLRRNNIEDLRPLAQLKNLRVLRLKRNNITDISPLSQLHRLEYLYLEHNKITDVQPLANLKNLVALHIEHNGVEDISSLDNLSLSYFHYDAICDMPALPLEPRINNRSYPSIFRRGIPIIANRPHASQIENTALNDLLYGPYFGLVFHETLKGITIGQATAEALASAIQQRDHFLSLNPNMIFIVEIRFRSASLNRYPSDSSYWLRDANGDIIRAWTVGYGVLDFTHPDVQDTMVEQAIAVSKCGLYDGIYFDYWAEDYPVLVDDKHVPQRGLEAELRARDNILTRIRSATRPEFLITGNTNIHIIPRSAPYVNGGAMETVMPHARNSDEIERDLKRIETSLLWLDKNLRHPQINGLEAWSIPTEPMTTTTNVRWMRAMTTLSLTHSDGYSVYARGTGGDEHHWYDFWDADLGRPVGEKGQLYQGTEGLYIREFTNGWAVYNHSGEAQVITLPEEVQGVASGLVNTKHALPNLDGEMYLKIKPKNPADVNEDGVVNILDLVMVSQGLGTDNPEADVNRDGMVNILDLVQVAGALGGDGAAPSTSSPNLSIISAADVAAWLAQAQSLGAVDANFQRGIRFLQQLLAALTPKETALLPNFPNPFNPETWIPYRLARAAEVTITIYDTKGTQVRRLALGNQAAGYYAERGKTAYWDGRNERGEAVASGIYIYQFRAGDYVASRRMVILK